MMARAPPAILAVLCLLLAGCRLPAGDDDQVAFRSVQRGGCAGQAADAAEEGRRRFAR